MDPACQVFFSFNHDHCSRNHPLFSLTFSPPSPPVTVSPPLTSCTSWNNALQLPTRHVLRGYPRQSPTSYCPSQDRPQCPSSRTRVASAPAFDVDVQKRYSVFAEHSLLLTPTT
ncbi:hypothetical protein BDZ89DRAFT_418235 [Hymenopellis radicata]|nr:hypothetical protein BDZ89DRAFT_418014 [Hymenopellis radicata]KAF9016022.1 hypothetical protein BDZ89DRAFT_418235 [Hymenopellis radicata]